MAGAEVQGAAFDASEHGASLKLVGVESLPSLAGLLEALVPAGAAPLVSLAVFKGCLEAAAVAHCTLLSSLTRLSLNACDTPFHQSDVPAVVDALLPAAPRLSELALQACNLRDLPACVTDMQGLVSWRQQGAHNKRLRGPAPEQRCWAACRQHSPPAAASTAGAAHTVGGMCHMLLAATPNPCCPMQTRLDLTHNRLGRRMARGAYLQGRQAPQRAVR